MSRVALVGALVRHRERVLVAMLDRLAQSDEFERRYDRTHDDDGVHFVHKPWALDALQAQNKYPLVALKLDRCATNVEAATLAAVL